MGQCLQARAWSSTPERAASWASSGGPGEQLLPPGAIKDALGLINEAPGGGRRTPARMLKRLGRRRLQYTGRPIKVGSIESAWSSSMMTWVKTNMAPRRSREAAEKPPWRTTCAKYCRSFRYCNDVSRLFYRFSKKNSVSVRCCLQAAPPKGQVLDIALQGEKGKLVLRHGIANTH